ncbi:hypothetical protein [Azorhizobium doebereinerae]|uniref:hypothetical protein n=1 Tax=Azorhizobium doebereinerae TaxID=281091 RepID=UPI0012EC3648|nr:hypothetical protein [Azorhizobium doebereinerae]
MTKIATTSPSPPKMARVEVQPFLIGSGWIEVRDGDDTARAIFERHYSAGDHRSRTRPKLICGPGQKLILVSADAGALCVWRRSEHRADGQSGVNCAVYRREVGGGASSLLLAAMARAWARWPGERLFTFVDPREVKPTFRASWPTWGHCYYQAGWRFAGMSKKRLHVLECLPAWVGERLPRCEAGCGL